MSKKLIVVIILLIGVFIALLFKVENKSISQAESRLISKMLENERIVEVFNMKDEGIFT